MPREPWMAVGVMAVYALTVATGAVLPWLVLRALMLRYRFCSEALVSPEGAEHSLPSDGGAKSTFYLPRLYWLSGGRQ